jgi:hypothetical protein
MALTDNDVAAFAQILREDHGIALSPEEARKEAEDFLRLSWLVLHPPKAREPP